MFSKKSKTKKDKKSSKKDKSSKSEDKKRLKREKKERLKQEKRDRKRDKKKDKKNKRKHKRMKSYHEYDIDDHVAPINFQQDYGYNHNQSNGYNKNVSSINLPAPKARKKKHVQSHSTPTIPAKQAIFEEQEDEYDYNDTLHLRSNGHKNGGDIETAALISNNKNKNNKNDNDMMGDDMDDMLSVTSKDSPLNNKETSIKYNNSTSTNTVIRRHHKSTFSSTGYNQDTPIDSNNTMISLQDGEHSDQSMTSHHNDNTLISRSTSHSRSSVTGSTVSRSSVSASSSDLNNDLMGHINHVNKYSHDLNGHIGTDSMSMVLNLGKGRRLSLEQMNGVNSSPTPIRKTKSHHHHHHNNTYSNNNEDSLSMVALNGKRRKSQKLNNRRTSAILGHQLTLLTTNSNKHRNGSKHNSGSAASKSNDTTNTATYNENGTNGTNETNTNSKSRKTDSGSGNGINLPLNTIISSQNKSKKHKVKEFRYRSGSKRNSGSNTSLSASYGPSSSTKIYSKSARASDKQRDAKYNDMGVNANISVGKKYNDRNRLNIGNERISSLSSSSLLKKKNGYKKPIGGGYGIDRDSLDNEPFIDNIPSHLRAYYAIQQDLNKLKSSTKKKANRTQLDAVTTKLHTLFFANERTNLPNLAAFQKFFIDRMSVKSVHKDLDWHISLLRPKIHSRLQDAQIDSVINVVADLLRKCVKKFNNKRGHLTSAANTNRIGIGTYGGGKDKNQIQSAFILSNKPSSSVPPEFYKNGNGSQSVSIHKYDKYTNHVAKTPSGSLNNLNVNNLLDYPGDNNNMTDSYDGGMSPSPYASDSEQSHNSHHSVRSDGNNNNNNNISLLTTYDVMTPPASVQLKQEKKRDKKEKQKQKHKRLLSFSTKRKSKGKGINKSKSRHNKGTESRPNMTEHEIVALTGLPGAKKVKGSDHHNVDEPYPMELFHISDMDFVLVYYVKFLTKFERIIVEFLTLYQQYSLLSDDIESDVALQLSLVASNPRETYLESMLKAHNTMSWGRQSREHPWIKVQTDKRKSQKFGQDLCYMVKYMKSNDIDALHELMKQAPDLNTKDRETGKTVLQIALDKSIKQPSFAFVARYLALKQLLFSQRLHDEAIIIQALETNNPMVAEILLHLEPNLDSKSSISNKTCLDLALNANYRNLARYMIKLNVPSWHNQQLIRRWSTACSTGDVVKLRSVLQRGFNIDYFPNDTQKTALIICTEKKYRECVEFLLKNNCNVNAQDLQQRTALHYAAINLDGELFRLILENRANWTLSDLDHKTPIKYVMEKIGFIPHKRPSIDAPTTTATQKSNNNLNIDTTNTRFRGGSSVNADSTNYSSTHSNSNLNHLNDHRSEKEDIYNLRQSRFWRADGGDDGDIGDCDNDSNASFDEYGYLVDVIPNDDKTDIDDTDTKTERENKQHFYLEVDVQQIVKIFDIACQASIPLDSRLLLLSVSRDWPHVILVLCQNKAKLNVDIVGKDGITPLMLAAREGKKACLSALLQSGNPDLDKADSADRTPIMHAAYRGESECVSRLLKAGASIDVETVDGTTLLMAACYGGLDEFAKYLIENNADVDAVNENGFSALLFASSEGYQDTVSLLLNNNASINVVSRAGLTPLMAGCSGGLHELVLYVLARINRCDMDESDENGWTALMHAVASGSEKCAAILLKAGASTITVGEDGYSLLSIAIMGNLIWMVRHILDCIRKQITISNKKVIYNMFNTREHGNGFSCIHEACGIGADKCLSLLLEYNEKYFDGNMILFDLSDLNGRSPLMIAALNGHQKCVQLLLNNKYSKIDVAKYDNSGNSTLIYAIESGQFQIVKLLIKHPIHYKKFIEKQDILKQAKQAAIQRGFDQMYQLLNTINDINNNNDNNQSPSNSTDHDDDDDVDDDVDDDEDDEDVDDDDDDEYDD